MTNQIETNQIEKRAQSMNIYVGNLPYSVRDDELRETFAAHGEVESAEVIVDRRTRRSRGYGFVKMASDDAGRKAIAALNGHELQGRALRVDESKPKSEKDSAQSGERRSARTSETARPQASQAASAGGGLFGFVRRIFG